MTVEKKNISYGLKNMKVPKRRDKEKDRMGDRHSWARRIQKQKAEEPFGRSETESCARQSNSKKTPKYSLWTNPLSNLDAKLRVSMRNEISKLHRQIGSTTIYVTHDQVEAMTMADRIVIMKDGFVQQVGKPMELYDHPVNKFVAGFIGSPQMNFFDVTIDGNTVVFADGNRIELPENIIEKLGGKKDGLILGIRGEDIKLDAWNPRCVRFFKTECGCGKTPK